MSGIGSWKVRSWKRKWTRRTLLYLRRLRERARASRNLGREDSREKFGYVCIGFEYVFYVMIKKIC